MQDHSVTDSAPPIISAPPSDFGLTTGVVCAYEARERAVVSGHGVGGAINDGSGRLRDIRISTQHRLVQEIWIRTAPDSEEQLTVVSTPDNAVKVREGHVVTAVHFRQDLWLIENHTLRTTRWLVSATQLAGATGKASFAHVAGALFAVSVLVPIACFAFEVPTIGWLLTGWSIVIAFVLLHNRSAASAHSRRLRFWEEMVQHAEALRKSARPAA